MSIALSLHLLSTVIWVGGMFFAWMVLRPVAGAYLEPPMRLKLWSESFKRFFVWVWIAVLLLPITGYWMLFSVYGSMAATPLYIHIMNGIGLVMIALFLFIFIFPYQRLKETVVLSKWPEGGEQLAIIRRIVGTNLILGLLTIVIAGTGRYL